MRPPLDRWDTLPAELRDLVRAHYVDGLRRRALLRSVRELHRAASHLRFVQTDGSVHRLDVGTHVLITARYNSACLGERYEAVHRQRLRRLRPWGRAPTNEATGLRRRWHATRGGWRS
jgi:hypothetical protein